MTTVCSKAGVALKIVRVEGFHSFDDALKHELYCGGELGPRTQVIASFHGGGDVIGDSHYLQLSADGREKLRPTDFFCWLRSPPSTPGSPEKASWKGIIHGFWCGSGRLRDEFLPGCPARGSGTVLSYSSRKGASSDRVVRSILDLCQFVGDARADPALLAPLPVAAHMLGVVGDTFICMGVGFEQTVVIGAPRTPEEAQAAYQIGCLEGRAGPQTRVAGAAGDLRAIAVSMREPSMNSLDPTRCRTKLQNVFATRYARDKLAGMDSLIQQHAFLSSLRLRDGSSVADMRERVNAILDVRQAVASLRSGRQDSGRLSAVLEQLHILARHQEDVEVDPESLLPGRPDLVTEGLRWPSRMARAKLFFDLLEARAACIDAQFVHEFLPLALESCAQVAMDLLAAAYPDPTLTDRIVQGIRQGASGRCSRPG